MYSPEYLSVLDTFQVAGMYRFPRYVNFSKHLLSQTLHEHAMAKKQHNT